MSLTLSGNGALALPAATVLVSAPLMGDATAAVPAMSNLAVSAPIVGSSLNLSTFTVAASSTLTMKADELVVKNSAGASACLRIFSQALDLTTVGPGGMDVGSPPNTGYVAIYAGVNPATGVRTVWAQNATAGVAAETYVGGQTSVSAYAMSALISVLPTDASGKIAAGIVQVDRWISRPAVAVLNNSAVVGSASALNCAAAVPANARSVRGLVSTVNTTINAVSTVTLGLNASFAGQQSHIGSTMTSGSGTATNYALDLLSPQQMYYSTGNNTGTPTFTVNISAYRF